MSLYLVLRMSAWRLKGKTGWRICSIVSITTNRGGGFIKQRESERPSRQPGKMAGNQVTPLPGKGKTDHSQSSISSRIKCSPSRDLSELKAAARRRGGGTKGKIKKCKSKSSAQSASRQVPTSADAPSEDLEAV